MQRRSKKLSPAVILAAFLSAVPAVEHSFFGLASLASRCSGQSICKQALHRRFGASLQEFLGAVLAHILCTRRAGQNRGSLLPAGSPVRRILVQDSVHLALHPCLRQDFPGSSNQHGNARAVLKIQATFDLLNHRMEDFTLSGFNRNDQAAAPDILQHLRTGDLILRDLGYFTLDSLAGIHQAGAFFVSRYSKAALYHPGGQRIHLEDWLLKKLRKAAPGTCLDIPVQLGAGMRLPMRLIAVRLEKDSANARRRRALSNRDARLKHTPRSLALLDWSLYLTNLPAQAHAGNRIAALYALRWRIEILFKSLKSQGLRLPALLKQPMNKTKLEALVESAMILMTLNTLAVPAPACRNTSKRGAAANARAKHVKPPRHVSLLKSARVMNLLLTSLLDQWLELPGMQPFDRLYAQFAPAMTYEKRRRKTSAHDLTAIFTAS
ncbi:hypothetical protein BGE01nite_57690 [Brevifollis gellanilyticus]|uniref:Transposase IS4-like domain-containing protein n=2 Tax=Brevifollis gellanilyticus TaxID=748831 RepID=A0A512MIC5_9BACT|nr:hypothetical protein BGE01nite_57690 [Brevifollis gellanilyticus]